MERRAAPDQAFVPRAARTAMFCLAEERRLHQRREALVSADVRLSGQARWRPCRIVDLSEQGCRIEGCGPMVEGSLVAIAMPGFAARRGRVMWSQDNMAGCRFERPLPPAVFDHIIHMSDPRGRG